MVRWYRAKEQDYTSEEVDGSDEKVGQGQELTRRIPGLKTLSWCYIKSMSLGDLEINRKASKQAMRPHNRHYIEKRWDPKEEEFV